MGTGWIAPVAGKPLKAQCRFCEVELNANFSDMKRHAKTSKHARNAAQHSSSAVKRRRQISDSPTKAPEPTTDGNHCVSLEFCRWYFL